MSLPIPVPLMGCLVDYIPWAIDAGQLDCIDSSSGLDAGI